MSTVGGLKQSIRMFLRRTDAIEDFCKDDEMNKRLDNIRYECGRILEWLGDARFKRD